MDVKKILDNPFIHRKEVFEWFQDFPLTESSIDFIWKLIRRVEGDLTSGQYIIAIVESKTVKKNPVQFLKIWEKYSDSSRGRWLRGLILSHYDLISIDSMESEDNLTKLAYVVDSIASDGIDDKTVDMIEELWEDQQLQPRLIRHLTSLADRGDFSWLFLNTPNEYLGLLLENLSYSKIDDGKFFSLLQRAISYDQDSADQAWHFIYFKINDPDLISELCKQTLTRYRYFYLQYFDWCIKEKIKKIPELVELIVKKSSTLDVFSKKSVWGILTEGNPKMTVKMSRLIPEEDDGSARTLSILGMYFSEIKQKLYRSGTKDDCMLLYHILKEWLERREYITVPVRSTEDLNRYEKNQILELVDEITEQLTTARVDFNPTEVLEALESYPAIRGLVEDKIQGFLQRKEYHPFFDVLRASFRREHPSHNWATQVLDKMTYYFEFFPRVENEKYINMDDTVKWMVEDLFNDLYGFLSEVFVFEKLHNPGILKICEPNIGGKNPDYLVELNGRKVIIEIKNFHTSQDLRISGFGSKMGKKFRRDLKETFKQTVPLNGTQYPVILVFDRSRSFIDVEMVNNVLHGSLSVSIPINDGGDDPTVFRENDFLAQESDLAQYIQAVILFTPIIKDGDIQLEGDYIEHGYRDSSMLPEKELHLIKELIIN